MELISELVCLWNSPDILRLFGLHALRVGLMLALQHISSSPYGQSVSEVTKELLWHGAGPTLFDIHVIVLLDLAFAGSHT